MVNVNHYSKIQFWFRKLLEKDVVVEELQCSAVFPLYLKFKAGVLHFQLYYNDCYLIFVRCLCP